jgi:tripeptide aminopeptidase
MSAMPDPTLIDLFLRVTTLEGRSGAERRVADFVGSFLRDLGLDPVEGDPGAVGGGDAGNVTCAVAGGGDRVLLAHMDTARPTGSTVPRIERDRIVSDGTTALGVDNRAGVAALLHAARTAVRDGCARGFTLAFTVCEETTLAGSRNLDLPAGVRHGFVFDSSLRPGHVIVRSPGARRFRARFEGRAAHAGIAPEKGVDALRVAARGIAAIPLGRVDEVTTTNVGTLRAGSAINVVPDLAVLEGEVRSLEVDRVEWVTEAIRGRFESEAERVGARLTFEHDWEFRPYAIGEDAAVRRIAFAAVEAVGLEPIAATSSGGSDANALNAAGVAAVNLGIGAQNPHGDDEFILVADLAAAADLALAVMRG